MNSYGLTLGVTAIANEIAKQYDDDEIALIGAVASQLGDTLNTIVVQRILCNSKKENHSGIDDILGENL